MSTLTSTINSTKLHPLLTYKPSTQSLQLHPLLKYYNNNKQSYHIISILQLKNRDYKLFTLCHDNNNNNQLQQHPHGLYISQPITNTSIKDGKQVVYIVLPSNQNKIGQKYQDLFAYIALLLSNVCIFDISSKYLRFSRNIQILGYQRNNYVVMNSHNNGGQIYKAILSPSTNITNSNSTNNSNSKMQISTKLSQQYPSIIKQLTQNLSSCHNIQQIHICLNKLLNKQSTLLLKNYINFQQFQYRYHTYLRIYQYLQHNNNQYIQLSLNKQMLTIQQLQLLIQTIQTYKIQQLTTNQQLQIIQSIKYQLIQTIKIMNNQLIQKLLIDIKNDYFYNVLNNKQLQDKKNIVISILEQYGINVQYGRVIFGEIQIIIQDRQKKQLQNIISKQILKIQQLQNTLQNQLQIKQNNQKILKSYQQKFLNFRQINTKYIQKCTQLQKQRHCTIKNKTQIQTLLIQQYRHQSIQQHLHNIIAELQQNKKNYQITINTLELEVGYKNKSIKQLENMISLYQDKIRNYQKIQGQAYKCIEDTQQAREQLRRYKDLVNKLQAHCQAYKKMEVQKFNYILRKNGQAYHKIKRQLQQKNNMIQKLNNQVNKLQGQVQQEKSRVKFCQEYGQKIGLNKIQLENKAYFQNDTSMQNNGNINNSHKGWITAI